MDGHDDFITVGHHDGRFIRIGGVFVLAARRSGGRAKALYVGEAADISRAATPGGDTWSRAIGLGMNELIAMPEERPEVRRRLVRDLIDQLQPPLNEEHA